MKQRCEQSRSGQVIGEQPFPHYRLEHVGVTVDDVDAIVEELRAKGVEIAGAMEPTRPWHTDFSPTRPAEGSALLQWI